MTTNPQILDMLGDELKTAIVEAQARCADDSLIARCSEALWRIERAGAPIATGLTYEAAIAATQALT